MSIAPPPLPQRDWAQRNRLWFLPLLVVLGLSLVGGAMFGIFSMVRGQMTSHPAYVESMARARANPQVVAALGQPIEAGWFVMGNVSTNNGRGHAFLEIPLTGPKQQAKLSVAARNQGEGSGWEYANMTVRLGNGEEISLLTAPPATFSEPSDDPDGT